LIAAADAMVASLGAKDPSLMPLAASVRTTENAFVRGLEEGVWAVAGPIDQARHLVDVDQCSTFSEIIITDPTHPYVLGVRLTVEEAQISEAEVVVTDEDDWAFSATGYLDCSEPQDWGPLEESQRVSRTELVAAADAYLDLFLDKSVVVPWDEASCSRLEGGGAFQAGGPGCQYSGEARGNQCNVGIPDDLTIGARRHYVDEETGSIVVICLFGGETFGMLDTHMFRIESGLIHYIHTLSVDGDQGTGTGW
jgi:hypothetical protein